MTIGIVGKKCGMTRLFTDDGVPKNSNGNPFSYRTYSDTLSTGEVRYFFVIEDIDIESPSYQESFTHNI